MANSPEAFSGDTTFPLIWTSLISLPLNVPFDSQGLLFVVIVPLLTVKIPVLLLKVQVAVPHVPVVWLSAPAVTC